MKVWLRRLCLSLITATLPILLSGCLMTMLQVANTGDGGSLAYGETVLGEVSDTFGQEWTFFGRTGDVVTITMTSPHFDTYVELYGPGHRRWYRRNNDSKEFDTNSRIAKYKLPHTGTYVIVAVGDSNIMSGTYSLTLQSPSPESSKALCVVTAYNLGMHSRQGMSYAQPIRRLRQNAQLRALSRNAENTWIEVLVEGSLDRGWVTTDSNYVKCDRSLEGLPVNSTTMALNSLPLGKESQ
jgi:hypothetical protein